MQTQLFNSSSPLLSFKPTRPVCIIATAARLSNCVVSPRGDTMYELLSVEATAGQAEIKAAYKRQAKKWHPDVCSSSADKSYFAQQFMKAKEAYEVLCDPILRDDYDLALRTGIQSSTWAGGVGRVRPFGESGQGGFGDWEAQLEELELRSSESATRGDRRRSNSASWPADL